MADTPTSLLAGIPRYSYALGESCGEACAVAVLAPCSGEFVKMADLEPLLRRLEERLRESHEVIVTLKECADAANARAAAAERQVEALLALVGYHEFLTQALRALLTESV